ncbi:MAG: cupin domain-containing protein [Chloroflexi bacterium]|nr:cupin domain-containing protein [Chloroflexota bacterium]
MEAEHLVEAETPEGILVSIVHFFDGARSKLHTHASEQIRYGLSGKGRVGTETESWDVRPGDTVYIPAGEKHWHAAAPGEDYADLTISHPAEMAVFE